MYSIGDFSKINRITTKTLRHYDKIDLLKPAKVDDWTGYRYYTASQLPVIRKILQLKSLGFSLEEIQQIMSDKNRIYGMLKTRAEKLKREREEIDFKLSEVSSYISELEDEKRMDNEQYVLIKALPKLIVASMRTKVDSYDSYFDVVPKMGEHLKELGAECSSTPYSFIIYHDGEYKESDIDVEICEAVKAPCEDSDKVKFRNFDEVPQAACLMHKGPYSTISSTYNRLFSWIDSHGFSRADNPRENYIDGIWNKDDPSEWRTEVQIPVKLKED